MKRTFLIATLILFTVIGSFAQKAVLSGTAEGIKWKKTEIDFGILDQGSPKVAEYEFTNSGSTPLIVTNAVGECGCTSIKWPKEPILPGKSGKISVTYDAANTGVFNKTVRVYLNIQDDLHELKLRGMVAKKP
jgi:hypothetical protein